jgi:Cu/Ag efflux pump CusA
MAIVVMGGLITSTFLTLFVIPLLYIFFDYVLKHFSPKDAAV